MWHWRLPVFRLSTSYIPIMGYLGVVVCDQKKTTIPWCCQLCLKYLETVVALSSLFAIVASTIELEFKTTNSNDNRKGVCLFICLRTKSSSSQVLPITKRGRLSTENAWLPDVEIKWERCLVLCYIICLWTGYNHWAQTLPQGFVILLDWLLTVHMFREQALQVKKMWFVLSCHIYKYTYL